MNAEDVYDDHEELVDQGEISPEEEGFMKGYEEETDEGEEDADLLGDEDLNEDEKEEE